MYSTGSLDILNSRFERNQLVYAMSPAVPSPAPFQMTQPIGPSSSKTDNYSTWVSATVGKMYVVIGLVCHSTSVVLHCKEPPQPGQSAAEQPPIQPLGQVAI